MARERWDSRRLVEAFFTAYRNGVVRGLFLSSCLYSDPDTVVEDMLEVVRMLRSRGFKGYIHVRLMPGVSAYLIREALKLSDRVGLNLEAPSPRLFSEIAPSKGDWLNDIYVKLAYAARSRRRPVSVDTQLVVGAAGESDREIIELLGRLKTIGVDVVHFSPYTPIPWTPLGGKTPPTPRRRVLLLYQAWRLIRDYGYSVASIIEALDDNGFLPLDTSDLKERIAELHPEWYPVDVNNASVEELLRVPGIGPRTAAKIARIRSQRKLGWSDIVRLLGVRRARRVLRYLTFS